MPSRISHAEEQAQRYARELEGHLGWLDSITGAALGVLAVASGIYTYLGVSSLLDDNGAITFFAAIAYSIAVSVGIFVFWSYLMRLLPAMRTVGARIRLFLSMAIGSVMIMAMSSWLNAAALAGAAAVEQHLAATIQGYQESLEDAHTIAVTAQGLERDVARVRQSFQDLSEQEAEGSLSGLAGRGAVFRVLTQKADELAALEAQISSQGPLIDAAFAEGNAILSRMRALTVAQGNVEDRSVEFSEEAVRLAGIITQLRQLSVAPLVARAADDLAASVVLPELDASSAENQTTQAATINSVLSVLAQRADSLGSAADAVVAMPAPAETTYTPLSTADAVIRYAGNFIPSWAGAIAIDLLPMVLVFIVATTQSAIRTGRGEARMEDMLTLTELRAALRAARDVEEAIGEPPRRKGNPMMPERTIPPSEDAAPEDAPTVTKFESPKRDSTP